MSKIKVLIVDNNKAARRLIRRSLRQSGFSNIEVEYAVDGLDALQKFKIFLPHLVLSDWHLTGMSGIELLQSLNNQYNDVNLAFITAEITKDMRMQSDENGALFFLAKPSTVELFKSTFAPYLEE